MDVEIAEKTKRTRIYLQNATIKCLQKQRNKNQISQQALHSMSAKA